MSWGKIIATAASVAAAGAGIWFKRKEVSDWFDAIVIKLAGKSVAVLGPRESGKTTLLTFLSTGELAGEYAQTLFSTPIAGNRFQLKDLNLTLAKTLDVSGSMDAFEDWRSLYTKADIGLYLVNAVKIERQRLERDLGNLESWKQERPKEAKLVIIVTHLDLLPGYSSLPSSERGNFRDRFVAQHLDAGLARLSTRPPIVMGSLNDKSSISEVAAQVITLVTQ